MSAAVIYQSLVQSLSQLDIPGKERQQLLNVLRRFEQSLVQLMYEWMRECGHDHAESVVRCQPILVQHALIHFADDMSDGDADYIQSVASDGVPLLCVMQNWVSLLLADSRWNADQRLAFFHCMHRVGVAQMVEIRTNDWDGDAARYAAADLNGQQFRAYFGLAARNASELDEFGVVGYEFGAVFHTATDVCTHDERFWDLSDEERSLMIEWANGLWQGLYARDIQCVNKRLGALVYRMNSINAGVMA